MISSLKPIIHSTHDIRPIHIVCIFISVTYIPISNLLTSQDTSVYMCLVRVLLSRDRNGSSIRYTIAFAMHRRVPSELIRSSERLVAARLRAWVRPCASMRAQLRRDE